MDQKRFITFIVLSMGFLIGWQVLIMPRFGPPKKPKAAAQPEAMKKAGDKKADRNHAVDDKGPGIGPDQDEHAPDDAPKTAASDDGQAPAAVEKPDGDGPADGLAHSPKKGDQKPVEPPLPKFPDKLVQLGSEDPQTGYRQLVTLTSRGAAVRQIELNDPRYRDLVKNADKVHPPLVVVGAKNVFPHTLEMEVPQLNADLASINWDVELSPPAAPHSVAVFSLTLDNLEMIKRYEMLPIDPHAQHPDAPAYALAVSLTFRNLGEQPRVVSYVLQGPTGLVLENAENTQKFRDVVVGFQADKGAVDYELMGVKAIADGKQEEWNRPLKYIGVDAQFFAALLFPVEDQKATPYLQSAKQQLISLNKETKDKSEISVELTSVELPLAGAKRAEGPREVTHSYLLFAGPKRDDVLPQGADQVVDFGSFFGMFRVDWISRKLLWLLTIFHQIFGSWGVAIICLTIVVRSALFPLSIKQARSAAKMQSIQPEIAALKEKYGKDKEKFARAQMELYSKHNFNPLAGCLPVFFQLPIFMGLYQALNHAVDLRLAGFLWFDNLAAPDAMFHLPFAIPLLGHEFNLLPLITIALFLAQQKMFMPPPTNDEEALRNKMMNFMMVFMGVMFYKVPAGLCVYFIASSLWGMGERKLLPKAKLAAVVEPPPAGPTSGRRKPPDSDDGDEGSGGKTRGGGLWGMLLKAAEKETSARRSSSGRRK